MKLFKDTSFLVLSNLYSKFLSLPYVVIVASALGPQSYGILKFIMLIPSLSKFGSISFQSVVFRESAYLSEKHDVISLLKRKNYGYSFDIFTNILVCFVLIIYFTIYKIKNIDIHLIYFTILSLLIGGFIRIHKTELRLCKSFKTISVIDLLFETIKFIFVYLTIDKISLFSPILAYFIASLFTLILLCKYSNYKHKYRISFKEFKRQLPVAVSLSVGTLIFGCVAVIERFQIQNIFNLHILGIYMLYYTILEMVLMIYNSFFQVYTVNIYKFLNSKKREIIAFRQIFYITIFIVISTFAVGSLTILVLPKLLSHFLPDYNECTKYFFYLCPLLATSLISSVYCCALNSHHMDKQKTVYISRIISIITFVISLFVLSEYCLPLESIIYSKIFSQLVFTLLIFYNIKNYLTKIQFIVCMSLLFLAFFHSYYSNIYLYVNYFTILIMFPLLYILFKNLDLIRIRLKL